MSYLVLARKYRPMTFEGVVAQSHVTRTLRNAIKSGRIGSSYLFCGPRGTGKTTIARILAKAINCANGPTETPCGECPACIEITSGSSLDVLEIDAASNTGVDDIRVLRENVRYLPTHGNKRIYIIDEVHRLSGSAFDALLKTLEEPPPHVMFMFATTEPLKIPDTILSRTQRFDFRRVSLEDLSDHLQSIAKKEGLDFDIGALRMLARKGDGSVRDSLSLMDQIAAFGGDHITEQDVITALGLVDHAFLFDYVNAIAEADSRKILKLTQHLFESGIDVVDFVSELLEHLRALLILTSDETAEDLIRVSKDEAENFRKQAAQFTVGDVLRLIKIGGDLNMDLKSNLDQRLLLEVAAVKMTQLESTVMLEDILKKLPAPNGAIGEEPVQSGSNVRTDIFSGASEKKKLPTERKVSLTRKPEGELTTPRLRINLAQLQAGWEDFLTLLRSDNSMLSSQLSMAELRSCRDNVLKLVFPEAARASLEIVTSPEHSKQLGDALLKHYNTQVLLEFETDPDKLHPLDQKKKEDSIKLDARKLVESSERLQKILKMVDGEVIGVRKVE